MGHVYGEIDDKLARWLTEQPVYFVGTAPSGSDGHVNVSPKGMAGTFAVLGPRQVGYLDYFGSGAETIAHVRDNGRIVLMFCSFGKRCRIIRLHGRAVWCSSTSPNTRDCVQVFPRSSKKALVQ